MNTSGVKYISNPSCTKPFTFPILYTSTKISFTIRSQTTLIPVSITNINLPK